MPRPVRSLLLACVAGALALTGCSVSIGSKGEPSPSAGGSSSASSGSTASSTGPIAWKPCSDGDDDQCAKIDVPLDYAKPDGTKIQVAVLKRPATDQAHKIGSLLVNPGGPGGSGIDFAKGFDLPQRVAERFDVIGFDPRGVGESSPISCHTHLQEMYDADPTMEDQADKTAYLKISQEYVDECATKEKAVLPYLGTLNVARDMDQIRQGLGEDKLNYLGYSYGTVIGQMYAQLFPTKIRTMVIDGVVNTQLTGLQAADEQAGGFEVALKAYEADCKNDGDCALGSDPEARVADLVAKAEQQPIPAPSADRPATPGVVQLAIGAALYSKSSWPVLSEAIQRGLTGDGSLLVNLADSYLSRNSDGSYTNSFDIYFAVSCLDSAWPKDPEEIFANAKKTGVEDPVVGEGLVNDYVRCALWPVKPEPLPDVTAPGSPPIVVVSTTRDPATPFANGGIVAKRLPQGVLVVNEGDGHTVYGQGKTCIDNAVSDYILTTTPPKNGLTCA